jgi:hypothetical protein
MLITDQVCIQEVLLFPAMKPLEAKPEEGKETENTEIPQQKEETKETPKE